MDAEAFGGDGLHGLHLVEDVFERREVVLHPGEAALGVLPDGGRHAVGLGGGGTGGGGDPGAVTLAEKFVDGDAGGPAHEVVHGDAEAETGFVADPVEGAGAGVLRDDVVRLARPAFAQANQVAVGVHDVNGAARGPVVVVQLVGD